MSKAWLDKAALLRIRNVFLERRPQLFPCRLRSLVLDDPGSSAHHVGEGPERDAVTVRETTTGMPVHALGQPVDVLFELPGQPGLSNAADADDGHEAAPAVLGRGVEELFDEAQLPVPADERRLECRRIWRHHRGAPSRGPPSRARAARSCLSAHARRRPRRRWQPPMPASSPLRQGRSQAPLPTECARRC